MLLSRRHLLAAPALLVGWAPGAARAQAWPARPVRMLVGYAPAGTTDIAGRLVAERLTAHFGQPFTVENRPGATGNIAAELVARSEPDGYTLYVTNIANAAINYSLFGARMPVRPEDFAEIGLLMQVPNVIFVPLNSPARTLQDFIALAKARPGALNYGSAGSGGSLHMSMELLKVRTGIAVTHVPFRGAGPMLVETMAGRLDAGCDNMPSCIGHVRDGRLRPLAVTTALRSPALPEVPTVAESGLAGFEATSWFGVQAPARTPRPIVTLLGEALDSISKEPGYSARLVELGAMPPGLLPDGGTSPETFTAFTRREIKKWAEAVRVSGATVD
jgi:tripartite-type tricarboxylate transporter receptor subunit TctC